MKTADLRIPFSWIERRPVLLEKCFYLPPFYQKHEEWGALPWKTLFGKEGPLKVEYCSGNGDWIVERARNAPETLWVAVEKRFDRSKKIWRRLKREGLDNLIVVCGEAQVFTKHYVGDHSVEEVFVNFPDPWPKHRHAKHRLLQRPFWEELGRTVVRGGAVIVATDDEECAKAIGIQAAQVPSWRLELATNDWPGYGGSWFSELWLGKGKKIYYTRYRLD